MNHRGFTLIELLITIVIVGIMALALGTSFSGTLAGNRIEAQTKELYTDMMTAKSRAMQRNRNYFVAIAADNYQVVEDTNRNNANDGLPNDTPLFATPKLLIDNVLLGAGAVVFNSKGVIIAPVTPATIRFDPANAAGVATGYDCIELQRTRVKMGEWDGGACNVK